MAKLSMEELAVQYGFAAAFFNSDAELRKLITDATNGQWSTQKFQAKFMSTRWYRSREASARQWADLAARDPAEAAAKIADRKAELGDRFTQLGITITDAELARIAQLTIQYSYNDAATTNLIAGYVKYQPGKTGGSVAAIESQIRKMAFDYGVRVSDQQMQDWIQGTVSEKYTQDNITDFLKDMALSKYGGMKGYLNQGLTVRDVASPYIQEYARLMEVNADQVSLDDRLISQALQGRIDPKTGLPQMQTVGEMMREVKRDPRWLKTQNAREDMTDMGVQILRDMGLYS